MDLSSLLPAGFLLCSHQLTQDWLIINLLVTDTVGTCPRCHTLSNRVHSFYQRTLADLPMSGKRVKLLVRLRKFFCSSLDCPRKVFAQAIHHVCQPYARRIHRADQQIRTIGLQTGAKPGARLCQTIGQSVSASTVLRLVRKTPLLEVETPKRLGIDDFAFKKGHTYGTILIDLDQRKPIDVLPDREGKTVADWLMAHPGIELVTRDRSSIYANAISSACPNALQVADRWRLLKNLSEAVERFLDGQRPSIREAAQRISQQSTNPVIGSAGSLTGQDTSSSEPIATTQSVEPLVPTERRYGLYQRAKELQRQGYSIKAIATHLGSSRNTVKKYFKQAQFVPRSRKKRSNLLSYESYLRQRWQAGETSVKMS